MFLVLFAGLSCARESRTLPDQTVPAWRLSPPTADIGVAEGEAMQELSQATSSLRLADGRIIVANSGSQELRVFDSQGKYLSTIGRKGEGPGEFDGSLQLRPDGEGRFTVSDVNLQKVATFDTGGHFLGESRIQSAGLTDFPLSTWLYRDNWIDGPVDTLGRVGVEAILDRLPAIAPGGYRFVKVADDGRLWIQARAPRDSAGNWQVYSGHGSLIATIAIPQDLEIHHVGHDFLTARQWGINDVEHIVVFPIEGVDNPDAAGVPLAVAAESGIRMVTQAQSDLAREVRNLVTVQEMYYADHSSYATKSLDLTDWKAPERMDVHLMAADRRGWIGLLVHRSNPVLCGMAVGGSTPAGWGEGSPKCSR
jgi:hypothetical protein